MSDPTATLIGAVIVALIGAALAPFIKSRIDARIRAAEAETETERAKVEDQRADKLTIANFTDKQLARLFERQDAMQDEMRQDLREKDTEIRALRREVEELRTEVIGYRSGNHAPAGFVIVPLSLWEDIRARLGPDVTGAYAGERSAAGTSRVGDPPRPAVAGPPADHHDLTGGPP